MNFNILRRVGRLAAIGAILFGSASCVYINETLGENLMPTDQKWDVYTPAPAVLSEIRMERTDSLSAYNSSRFTFGSINDPQFGTSIKSTSFTLVPIGDSLSFGENVRIRQFHFTAALDTVSTLYDNQSRIIQNVYVSELKAPLDTHALYIGTFMNEDKRAKYLNLENRITAGTPVYDGGDSLSFDFSLEYAAKVIEKLDKEKLDSIGEYTAMLPGIFITTDTPAAQGGRINMFRLGLQTNDGYVTANYAELKVTADFGERKDVDTTFLFFFGPGRIMKTSDSQAPDQFAFNTSNHETYTDALAAEGEDGPREKLHVEGGAGAKPVITAKEIKSIVTDMLTENGIENFNEVVINKATVILPYQMPADYKDMELYPTVLSPTVKLHSENGGYVTYAGLTDSSIESEDQGDINRSTCLYSPDISHHVQEILKLDENAEDFEKKISSYDIWMLIMHDEIQISNNTSSNNDLYNSLAFSSYYNNMMYGGYGGYGGYGYGGYGYGYGGYGYDSYGYGYNNYYNYMMMASMAGSYSTGEKTARSIDKDRFYHAVLNGPDYGSADDIDRKPRLKITFSAPKSAEK